MIQPGQANIRGSISSSPRSQWNDLSQINGEAMCRMPARNYIHRNSTNSYDQAASVEMYPSISQMSFQNSSARSDITGRSSPDNPALYSPTQQTDLLTYDHLTFPAGETFTGQTAFHRVSLASNASLISGPSFDFHAANSDEPFALTISQDAAIYTARSADNSPTWNGSGSPNSHRSSPTLEEWSEQLPLPQMSPGPNSPLEGLPTSVGCVSSKDFLDLPPYPTSDRIVKKPMGPRASKVASDYNRQQRLNGTSAAPDESSRLVGRSSLEIDNTARDHELYQNVTVHADGLYHCPWEGKEGCQHKAEKLKCNYE